MSNEIIIVSGLPRSGTSLMMQMLVNGGMEVLTDEVRQADADNPRGYYEYEKVKKIKQDITWLPETRGKAFKMVSQLLYDLPPTEKYRILFMERDLDEVVRSQEKMLARLGRTPAPHGPIKMAYGVHLERLQDWLKGQANMAVQRVSFHDLIQKPLVQARQVRDFLGKTLDLARMVQAVDASLYRTRNETGC